MASAGTDGSRRGLGLGHLRDFVQRLRPRRGPTPTARGVADLPARPARWPRLLRRPSAPFSSAEPPEPPLVGGLRTGSSILASAPSGGLLRTGTTGEAHAPLVRGHALAGRTTSPLAGRSVLARRPTPVQQVSGDLAVIDLPAGARGGAGSVGRTPRPSAVQGSGSPGLAVRQPLTSPQARTAGVGPPPAPDADGVGATSSLAASRNAATAGAAEPLARPPTDGPVVSGPTRSDALRVLGEGAVVPAGEGVDPSRAFRIEPQRAQPIGLDAPIRSRAPGRQPGLGGQPDLGGQPHLGGGARKPLLPAPHRDRAAPADRATEAARRPSTPEQRWDAAVAARPLDAPRALPSSLHALAEAITGRRTPVTYTSGPATRAALTAAGALGATTGQVVHLPSPPSSDRQPLEVLAHELAHTRSPVVRPRFLLAGHDDAPDADEQRALETGQTVAGGGPTGGGVQDLPVAGSSGGLGTLARREARAAVLEAAGPQRVGPAASQPAAGPTDVDGAPATAAVGATRPGTPPPAAPGTGVVPDMDRVVEALEERLLAEIERRGGRWAGVF